MAAGSTLGTASWLAIVSPIALIVGTILGAWLTHRYAARRQSQIWLRDFDRFEAERLLSLFEEILLQVQQRSKIDERTIDRLTVRALLIRYLTADYREKVSKLKELCFNFREALDKSAALTTGVSQEEEHYREEISKLTSELVDDIRNLFGSPT